MLDDKNLIVFKIIKEFNIGLNTLNEFLKSKKLINTNLSANSKIPIQWYELIQKEFKKDKILKSVNVHKDIETHGNISTSELSVSDTIQNDTNLKVSEETNLSDQKAKNIKNTKVLDIKTSEPITSSDDTMLDRGTTVAENIETSTDTSIESEQKTITSREISLPKILGKIELEDKKSRKKKEKIKVEEAETSKDEAPHLGVHDSDNIQKQDITVDSNNKLDDTQQSKDITFKIEEHKVESVVEQLPTDTDVEKIIIEVEKLRGPIIKGKIELIEKKKQKIQPTSEQKQVADIDSSTEIQQQRDLKKPEEQQKQHLEKIKDKEKQPVFRTREYRKDDKFDKKQQWVEKDNKNKPIASSEAKISKHKRRRIEKHFHDKKIQSRSNERTLPEVSDEEIQKQIKETLARLTATKKSKTSKYKRERRQLLQQQHIEELERIEKEKKILRVTEFITVNDLASLMNVPVNQVITTCLNLGLFVSINQRLDAEVITIVADEFAFDVEFIKEDMELVETEQEDDLSSLVPRHPVVTVMGHVDHGKTSLLDYIRKTNIIAGEAGGITQHIGAYEVQLNDGRKITFLDTPGHEAFTAMRARGAKLTDLAIIVIAADDRVMPQTIEAINHARAAGVPMVFAINKIDKPNANPEKIKEELAQMNILVEDWGGKYQCQEISAKHGTNVDLLLEKVLLESELLDLKANPNRPALGTVIESSLEKGLGYVAKMLVQNGVLRVGDIVVAGCHFGKVKALLNERNQRVQDAGPSTPVLMVGFESAPNAGDKFQVYSSEKEAKQICAKRQQLIREQGLRTQKHITLDEIGRRIAIGDFKELNLIVKGDVDGSVEALSDALLKLSSEKVQVNVIHKSVGQIIESDVLLASASDAIIIGFQVRPSPNARKLAEQEQIDIRTYSVIYDAIEEIKAAIAGMLAPEFEENIIGNAEVREIFKISKVGTVAGCYVLDGKMIRNSKVRIIRDGIVIYDGKLSSLKRFKDDVKEVAANYECGLTIDNFNDIKVGDIIEGYEVLEKNTS